MAKKLIVNADDFGHTPGVSAGIRQGHLHGIVTSTSAMMNRPLAPAELTVAARTCPNLGIGVHLVLTAGKPVLSAERLSTLVDGQGNFLNLPALVDQINQIDLEQVWAEWNAQVEKFTRHYGRNPDHLDSHHHVSYFTPALFERMVKLAEQLHCGIRKPFGEDPADAANYLPEQLVAAAMHTYAAFASQPLPPTTDVFISDFYDEGATLEHLLAILGTMAADPAHETFELMCHPAKMDHELHGISDYNDKRIVELAILQDSAIRDKVDALQIKLITYADL
jgi:predicted glycoside hydrolase/deacetylase ChbG (UPF0249 family)